MTPSKLSIGDARLAARTTLRPLVDSPQLEADIIVSEALSVNRESLSAMSGLLLNENQKQSFENLLKRRTEGEPIAYITGTKQFWNIDFVVNTHTLVPRPETELLVERALAHASTLTEDPLILDLGTGCGAIAVTLANEIQNAGIDATDISDEALEVARINRDANHANDRIRYYCGCWFSAVPDGVYHIIVANPPYIRSDDPCLLDPFMRFEPHLALTGGEDGFESICQIITGSTGKLLHDGWLIIEHGYDQGDAVRSMMTDAGLSKIQTLKDLAHLDRVTEGCNRQV